MTYEDKLIKRMEQGDAGAVDELIERFYPEILRYCLWHAPNRSLAEDAAQETFLKFIRFLDQYTHKGRFKPFLYQIAANTCIDMQRKKRNVEISLEGLEIESTYAVREFESVESDMAFGKSIDSLPEELRELIILRYGQELTLREIAEAVNMPLRTVQSRLRSALKRLKKEFEEGGTA